MTIETVLQTLQTDQDLLELSTEGVAVFIDCIRSLDAMRERFYCPKDPVWEEAVAVLKRVEGLG